jgi:hypothetical protein
MNVTLKGIVWTEKGFIAGFMATRLL